MGSFFGGLIASVVGLWCLAAMAMHIWVCVATNWAAMLIAGLFIFPIGLIHGSGLILGWW